jgi:hypothetical protein
MSGERSTNQLSKDVSTDTSHLPPDQQPPATDHRPAVSTDIEAPADDLAGVSPDLKALWRRKWITDKPNGIISEGGGGKFGGRVELAHDRVRFYLYPERAKKTPLPYPAGHRLDQTSTGFQFLLDVWDAVGARFRPHAGFLNRYEADSLIDLIKSSLGLDKEEREAIYAIVCSHILRKLRRRSPNAGLYD